MTDYKALVEEARFVAMFNLADAVEALVAERDALRAQLDNMTTEWGLRAADDYVHGPYYEEPRSTEYYDKMQRKITPWVEVQGEGE